MIMALADGEGYHNSCGGYNEYIGLFNRSKIFHVFTSVGYHEYIRGCSIYCRDITMYVGGWTPW